MISSVTKFDKSRSYQGIVILKLILRYAAAHAAFQNSTLMMETSKESLSEIIHNESHSIFQLAYGSNLQLSMLRTNHTWN